MNSRMLRRLIPSVPILARTPVASFLDSADAIIKWTHPEWSHLPPASLRMRIGVGSRILNNHEYFIASARELIGELSKREYLTPHSQVLEMGCGCGRNALALSRFLADDGSYVGQDVDAEMIAWCTRNLATDRFRFEHNDQFSAVYNPTGSAGTHYRLPVADGSRTLIIAVSVYSHLLYEDARRYIEESGRVMAPGGYMHMTWFIMEYLARHLGKRWTFAHREDRCYVEDLRYPEAAVAYDFDVIKGLLDEHGFDLHAVYHEDRPQQTVIARKR
jgi:SAM-dependent methyltransferase